MTRRTTARGGATVAALGVIALGILGSTAACASNTTPTGGASAHGSATPSGSLGGPTGTPTTSPTTSPSPSAPGGAVPTPPVGVPSTGTTAKPGQVKALGYSASGTVLTVYFYAGVCQKFGLHTDQSTSGQVLATVVVTQWPKTGQLCPSLIKQQAVSADLGSPLNGRTVLDTVSGKALPQLNVMPGSDITHGPIKS